MRLFVVAFLAGAWYLQQQAELPRVALAPCGFAALLALALVPPRLVLARVAILLVAGALTGFGWAAWRAEIRLADALPAAEEGEDIAIEGIVASLPQVTPGGARFVFDVESVETRDAVVPGTISLAWYAERVKGSDESVAPPQLVAGDRWRLTVRLKRPRGLANPHGFELEPWALERGIRATGYVRARIAPQHAGPRAEGWPYTLHRWRGQIRDAMAARLGDERFRGVLVALAIGDQDSISQDDWEVFWRTGVGHLMSISGLHITMLAALAGTIAFFAWVRVPALALRVPARKAAVIVGVMTALAYSLMTGYAVPAQRTFAMLAVVAACVLADRHGSPSRVLAAAAFGVTVLDPWAMLSPGFWLSFGAVASIFYAVALRAGRPGRIHAALVEQLAVTLAMMPMMIALFQQVSLVSPIANAFAIPVVSLVVVPLTLAGAFLPFPLLLDGAHGVMEMTMVPLEWLASSPLATLETHEPVPWTVVAALVGCAWLLAPRGVPMRSAGAFWIAPMFLVVPPSPANGEAWLDVLEVGNGLAVVVRTASHALVYDTGPSWNADADSGNRIVVPFLRGEGIALDGVVVTHADDDHSGGAYSIAHARPSAWLVTSVEDEGLHAAFASARRCEAGDRWRWNGVTFEMLHPPVSIYSTETVKRKENDRGCVLRVATAGASILLTADVEARAESEMLKRDVAALRSSLMLVPHHGSKTSSTPAFIDAVAPGVAIASVGYRNRFHHPNEAVVARYAERGIEFHRTDREGEIHIVLPADRTKAITVEGYAALSKRYWSER
ncbi:MAG: DNA internalization-related competence protein ComEC/Rec2 [Usitatibacter sp.]